MRRFRPCVETLEDYTLLSTLFVTNNLDAGPGSLRQAILDVDSDPDPTDSDLIEFQITHPYGTTIQPLSQLPPIIHDNVTITGAVTLDGSRCGHCDGLIFESNHDALGGLLTITHFEEAGVVLSGDFDSVANVLITANGQDGVYINGSNTELSGDEITANGYNGVDVTGNDNMVGSTAPGVGFFFGGNWISGNAEDGVNITDRGSGNVLVNNFIGTDLAGTSADGNGWSGVVIYNAPDNRVGGTVQAAGNVIAANGNSGIWIAGSGSTNEVVQANKVGTDFSGRYALGNAWSDISVTNDAGAPTNVLIGGTVLQAQNIIASAGNAGVWINGSGVTGIVVQGDHIGNDITGEVALANAWGGVIIGQGASSATLADNLISGNTTGDGVTITDAGTSGNLVVDNWIGIDEMGTQPLGNGSAGVNITNDASNNTVGGTTLASLNVISANGGDGVALGVGTSGNVVQGNYIGTNDSGTSPLGNGNRGIGIYSSSGNLIGGTEPGAGNTIDDNVWEGVAIIGASDNLVEGNRIGTDDSGLHAMGNHLSGVGIWGGSTGNTIGGSAAGAGNLISGNATNYGVGVGISDAGTSGNLVEGNLIGTDATGRSPLGNNDDGVEIGNGASDNTIGGPGPGDGNVISANAGDGVGLGDAGTTANVVRGNLIGTDSSGTAPLGNGNRGVGIYDGASGNLVGGTATGDGNTIADNVWEGIAIYAASDDFVEGNRIGTDFTGLGAIGNQLNGIGIWGGSTGNTIGGASPGAGNLISGNGTNFGGGIAISDPGTSSNVVQGNLIGTDTTGRAPLGNIQDGIYLNNGASDNTIGGAAPGDENVISANGGTGVWISDGGTTGNVLARNFIGTDITGTRALGNLQGGVAIVNGASGNFIGSTDEGGGNFISANGFDGSGGTFSGIMISGDTTDNNVVQHNIIGLAAGGESALPNAADGVDVFGGADGNTIGGSVHHSENVISGNVAAGVVVSDFATNRNVIQGNLIGNDLEGNTAIPNGSDGVQLVNTHSNTVGGGTTVESRNIIAGNAGSGVALIGAAANTVAGNSIGVGLGGAALGNQGDGVDLYAASSFNVIGGTDPTSVNVISANGLTGVKIDGTGADFNVVEGNLIGLDGNGTGAMGNADEGVLVADGASNNTIGGTSAGAGNLIAFNSGNGVTVGINPTDASVGNSVLENSIFANDKLGIDLGDDGVTLNDSSGHTGPNLFQDFPVLSAVSTTNGVTTIAGSLSGAPDTVYRIEFYLNPAADPSEYCQGESFVTFSNVTTDGTGQAAFSVATPAALPINESVSATATDPNGNTSEFAADLLSSTSSTPTISDAGFEQPSAGPAGAWNSFDYDPTGTAWIYAGSAGVAANGSGFTAGNPPAPEGVQVGFLQMTGSFIQSVSGWAAGSYVITFDAAQRGNYGSNQDFEVLVDGNVVATFDPSGTSYQAYSTAAFTVAAGSHTITFQGLDSAGGDNTALLDDVAIS